jgi:hypothetical protein
MKRKRVTIIELVTKLAEALPRAAFMHDEIAYLNTSKQASPAPRRKVP